MASPESIATNGIDERFPSAIVCSCSKRLQCQAAETPSALALFLQHRVEQLIDPAWPKRPHNAAQVLLRCAVCKDEIDVNEYERHLRGRHGHAGLLQSIARYRAVEPDSSYPCFECDECVDRNEFHRLDIATVLEHSHPDSIAFELYLTCRECGWPVALSDAIAHAVLWHTAAIEESIQALADVFVTSPISTLKFEPAPSLATINDAGSSTTADREESGNGVYADESVIRGALIQDATMSEEQPELEPSAQICDTIVGLVRPKPTNAPPQRARRTVGTVRQRCVNCAYTSFDPIKFLLHIRRCGNQPRKRKRQQLAGKRHVEKGKRKKTESRKKPKTPPKKMNYHCEHCSAAFERYRPFKDHCDTIHAPPNPEPPTSTHASVHSHESDACPQCGKFFSSARSLYMHRICAHLSRNLLGCYCPECGMRFTSMKFVRAHNFKPCRYATPKPDPNPTLGRFVKRVPIVDDLACRICSLQFAERHALEAHFEQLHIDVLAKCRVCERIFTTAEAAQTHERIRHPRYRCTMGDCAKEFDSEERLGWHCRFVHVNQSLDGVYQCQLCLKAFESSESLRLHAEEHESAQVEARDAEREPYSKFMQFCCRQCPETFESVMLAREHYEREHGGIAIVQASAHGTANVQAALSESVGVSHEEQQRDARKESDVQLVMSPPSEVTDKPSTVASPSLEGELEQIGLLGGAGPILASVDM